MTIGHLGTGKLIGDQVDGVGPHWDQPIYDFGYAAFTLTTDTQVEIPTTLTVCYCAIAIPATIPTTAADDTLYCDRVITSAAITVGRDQEVADNLEFSYLFIGY